MRVTLIPIARFLVAALAGLVFMAGSARPAWAQGNPLGSCGTATSVKYDGEASGSSAAGRITGHVQIECDRTWIFADVVSWDATTIRAEGDVLVIQPGLRINADRAEMDRQTHDGTFHRAYGTAQITDRAPERNMFGAMEPDIMFRAELIEKTGPRTYRLTHGSFTTCVQPTPRWDFTGSSGSVTLDEHVIMKNLQLRVKHVPVLYLPVLYYPLKKDDRATGFLIPTYSASGVRGQGVSTAFFWAINRSQDATLYYDWYSRAGQGAGAEYRYVAAPGSQGEFRGFLMDERARVASDGTIERPANRWYDIRGTVNQRVGSRFRLVGRAYYFSDQTSLLLYQQNVYDQSRRDRDLSLQLAGNLLRNRLRVNVLAQQRDIFNGATAARKSTLPQVDVWLAGKAIGRSKVYFSASGQAAYLDVRPDPSRPQLNRALWRADGQSTVRAPLSSLSFLSVTASASWRVTAWSDSLDPLTGQPAGAGLARSLFDLRADAQGPTLSRVFQTPKSGYAERLKHIIEPRVSVQYLSPFGGSARVIAIDPGIDQLVGGTISMNYGLVNRLLARVRRTGSVREMLSVTVGQSYYSNAAAAHVDPNYPNATAGTFSPVQISASVSPTDEVSGRFQMYVDSTAWAVRSYSATAIVTEPRLQLQAGWSRRLYLPTVPGFDNPASASHFLNASATTRTADGRFGGTYGFNYDLRQRSFLQQRLVGYYSTQCCGVSVDYQTIAYGQTGLASLQRDRRVAVTFTLAGIGSFASPLGAFGR